jgi:hypothetical protein
MFELSEDAFASIALAAWFSIRQSASAASTALRFVGAEIAPGALDLAVIGQFAAMDLPFDRNSVGGPVHILGKM